MKQHTKLGYINLLTFFNSQGRSRTSSEQLYCVRLVKQDIRDCAFIYLDISRLPSQMPKMPLRFLQSSKKDKPGKLTNKSKSTTDLFIGSAGLTYENNLTPLQDKGMKTRSKSRISIFSSNKNNSQITLKESKKNKENTGSANFAESKRKESAISYPGMVSELGETAQVPIGDHDPSENDVTLRKGRPKRSSSCCAITELTNRERRLSDIAQLEQYIEYHQRRGVDDGCNTKRLVCAQLLRQSFLAVEQMRNTNSKSPQEKPDFFRSMSNLNTLPNSSSIHLFQKNKTNPGRRWSQWSSQARSQESRLCVPEPERRRSWNSADTNNRDVPIQFVVKAGSDNYLADTANNYRRESEPVDITVPPREVFKKPKFMSKRKSVPVFTAQEIEIF